MQKIKDDIEHSWRVENGKVFWGSSNKPIRGADAASFEPLNEIWARDKKHIFVYDTVLRGADVSSFQILNMLYAKDDSMAYYSYGRIKDADPSTFIALDDGVRNTPYNWKSYGGFASDGTNIYHYDLTVGKPSLLRGADPDTFEVLSSSFARDCKFVFHKHTKLPRANPETIKVLGFNYARDSSRVYYINRLIKGADPSTFVEEPDGKGILGADKYHSYERDEQLSR